MRLMYTARPWPFHEATVAELAYDKPAMEQRQGRSIPKAELMHSALCIAPHCINEELVNSLKDSGTIH